MKKAKHYLIALLSGVLVATTVLSGCGQSEKAVSENDDHLTVYLWENRLMKNIVPYIYEQFPDQDIEFITGNNDTDLYSYFEEHGELPDIITVRRFSGTDAQNLEPYLMDFASYDVVSRYYSYALQYYKNSKDEIQWLPICGMPQTIIANKTLFEQFGIKIPENYKEYAQACQQFYDNGIKPYSLDLAEDWSAHEVIQTGAIGEFMSLDGIKWRNFENEYSISLNDKNGRDAASSILTTIREENDAQLALVPYYYFTSSIYKGECTGSRVALMTAKSSDTPLYLAKINGKEVYELAEKYLADSDEKFHVTNKYELPIASGMKIIVSQEENGFSLQDIEVNKKKTDKDKGYSILLTDTTMSVLKKINPECEIRQLKDTTLSSAWTAAMANGQQPSAPEDYIEVEK